MPNPASSRSEGLGNGRAVVAGVLGAVSATRSSVNDVVAVLGTAATPEILSRLPRERVVAALDARHGQVVVDGWRTETGESILDRMRRLRDLALDLAVGL